MAAGADPVGARVTGDGAKMIALPDWFTKLTTNDFGTLPQWVRSVFRLRAPDVPKKLLVDIVVPSLEMTAVSASVQTGTSTVAGAGAFLQLPDIPGTTVLIQADPANVDNVILSMNGLAVGIVLRPADAFAADVANLNLFFIRSSGAGAVTVNWIVGQPL